MLKPLRRRTALLALAFCLAVPAFAHSKKEASSPADGATLSAAPEVITLTFDKPTTVTSIRLTGSDGTDHEVERRSPLTPATTFEATPAAIPAGSYIIEWRGLAEDGHPLQGTVSFSIQ
ncbi:copper resistance CopC family protein [Algicella marina]|uniref:copper resistance CopC family protein n=1 Tax=Algicella marina TaxID=2683284 RepID=UPI0024DFB1DC|nr:copper resistance protein CopC [Algicella marina]